jgi:hypothetical protein
MNLVLRARKQTVRQRVAKHKSYWLTPKLRRPCVRNTTTRSICAVSTRKRLLRKHGGLR